MRPTPPLVLVFAANDPTAGTGLAADLTTLASLGCHALPVVTALTVQDTAGLLEVQAIEADWVNEQARYVLEDMQVDAIKVGLAGSIENLTVIAEIVADYPNVPLVLDPVLEHSQRDEYSTDEFAAAIRELLLPNSFIVCTNSSKARRLGSDDAEEQDDLPLDAAASRLIDCGCEYVLITGAQEHTSKVSNVLYSRNGRVRSDMWDRLPGRYHGSGATLSAALAGALASGVELNTAVHDAQEYVWQTLVNAYRPGMGQLVPDRMFWARPEDTKAEE
ncbi:hydroxymethylpyrimidine/phosphomethylpyrimidine kinase [Chitiniphilus shinanonensis]|uniref:hydroxymethylpyrimidine kinase n=1 Tax=Chitiniphilus shinanonensis TaxID=553088 RepID=A0ABQ6BMW7_9NEIS|nr:hydroxymethylpyrimidine/phosphomethylpyrimidine kinase [Chitiniphilus shinanonensis]GLS02999.1 hydroxymethylpyrimidine/phosphomethylpyrimidine kinase [Chitiniphilus shinanonensis]